MSLKKKIFNYSLFILIFLIHQYIFLNFFPNNNGFLGHDYEYFLPNFIFGQIWFKNNFLSIPWFTPSFCCGIPFYPDPQTMFYSLQQFFYILFEPILATKFLFIYLSFIAYVGMFLLLKKNFNFNYYLSLLGATIFFFNGYFIYRTIVGHIGYANYIFVPIYCFFLISSITHVNSYFRKIYLLLSSVTLSTFIYSGTGSLMFLVLISIISILLIYYIIKKNFKSLFIGFLKSSSIGFLLSLSKLSAVIFFLKNFKRDYYEPLFFENTYDYLYSTFKSLFLFPDIDHFNNSVINNAGISLNIHEIEYGVSIVPFIAFLIFVLNFKKIKKKFYDYKLIFIIIFISIIPLILNIGIFSIDKVWGFIPILGSTWVHIRWNTLFIIPLIIFSLAIFNSNIIIKKNNYLIVVLIFIVILQNVIYDKKYYHNQNYNPESMIELSKNINKNYKSVPIKGISVLIDKDEKIIANQRNDNFKIGLSSYFCYQPIFGYSLQKFPNKNLKFNKKFKVKNNKFLLIGDTNLGDDSKNLNFLNPSCFLFPEKNNCTPGDLFKKTQISNLDNFLKYEKIKFKKNFIQIISDYISLLAFIFSIIFLITNFYNLKKTNN